MLLVLTPSGLPPIVPAQQSFHFADDSRNQLYSKRNYRASAYLAHAIYEEHVSTSISSESRTEANVNESTSSRDKRDLGIRRNGSVPIASEGVIPSLVSEQTAAALTDAAGAVGR